MICCPESTLKLNTTVRKHKKLSSGGIQWMSCPSGICAQGRWNPTFLRRLRCYCQPPPSSSSVSNPPPPPREDLFLKLSGEQRFTKLELKTAYQQLPLDPGIQQFVTINTPRGLYRYKRPPSGIAPSPAVFQRTMDIILQGLDNVESIKDEILIPGKDDEEHMKNLDSVLSRLDHYGLRLRQLSKCKFMQKSVTYMGCVLSASGISPIE